MLLPTLALALSALSPEVPLSRPSVEVSDTTSDAVVATSPQVALFAWRDSRPLPGLYVGRVASNGTVPQPFGTLVDANGGLSALAFDGTNFLLVWARATSVANVDLLGLRFDAQGTRLDPTPRVLASNVVVDQLRVAADGSQFVVVWSDDYSYGDLLSVRVSAAGQALDATPRTLVTGISFGTISGTNLDVAATAGVTLVAWKRGGGGSNPTQVLARRVASDGTLIDTSDLGLFSMNSFTSRGDLQLAANATGFAVVGLRRVSFSDELVLVPVGTSGALAAPVVVAASASGVVSVAPSASGGWAVLESFGALLRFEVSAQGVVSTPSSLTPPRAGLSDGLRVLPWPNAFVLFGGRTLLSFTDPAWSQVTSSRSPANTSVAQDAPAVASAGPVALAVWRQARGNAESPQVRATRVDVHGVPLDDPPLALSSPAMTPFGPAVTFDGQRFVVAWSEFHADGGSDLVFRQVDLDGGLDPAPRVLIGGPADSTLVTLAGLGGQVLACWQDRNVGAKCRVTDGSGQAVGAVFALDGGTLVQDVDVATDGVRFFVASALDLGGLAPKPITLAAVTPAGVPGPARQVSVASTRPQGVRAAANSDAVLVAWEESLDRVWTVRVPVSPDGGFDAGVAGAWVTLDSTGPFDVAWAGGAWWLGLTSRRLGSGDDLLGWKLNGATAQGTTTVPQVLVSNLEDEAFGGLAALGDGVAAVYVRDDVSADQQAPRAKLRLWGDGAAAGVSCTFDTECVSNHCGGGMLCCPAGCLAGCDLGQCLAPPTQDAGLDAGLADAGLADAGLADAGLADAGLVDAGLADAGLADAGLADAGLADAGLADAGLADAGVADAGVEDGGSNSGGGGGSQPTGGGGGGAPTVPTGCGCTGSGVDVSLLAVFVAMLRRRL